MKKLFLLLLIGLSACETIVEDPDLGGDELLAFFSFISPQEDTVTAVLALSTPLFGEPPDEKTRDSLLSHALVMINGPHGSDTLRFKSLWNHMAVFYIPQTGFSVENGGTYTMEASLPDGKNAKGTCTVPTGFAPDINIQSITTRPSSGNYYFDIDYTFKDEEGEGDCYHVYGEALMAYKYQWPDWIPLVLTEGQGMVSDKGKDLTTFHFRSECYGDTLRKLKFYSLRTDEAYYHYHISLSNYEEGNPFSEPSMIYSNLSSGIGIFAAYTKRIQEIDTIVHP